MIWSKKDSDNLASIASSLEKIAEREVEREIFNNSFSNGLDESIISRIKTQIRGKKESITVHEPSLISDEAMEEDIKTTQRMQNKAIQAEKDGNMPFFAEALFDEEELETL